MRAESVAKSDLLDLVVVGAGPCGLAVAVAAKEHGLRCTVVEKGSVTNSLLGYPYYMTFFSTAERLEIGRVPFTIADPKPTRRDALAYYRQVVSHHGLDVRQHEEVTEVQRTDGLPGYDGFVIQTRCGAPGRGRKQIKARTVVIATGGFGDPNRLELLDEPGNYPKTIIHYYREPYPFFGQDVLVVGGGNSAVEAALDMHRNGVRVRMVHFGDTFDRGVKPWVRPDIDNRVKTGEIEMHWRSRVVAVNDRTATIVEEGAAGAGKGLAGPIAPLGSVGGAECSDSSGATGANKVVPADWVLAMTGWQPDRSLLDGLGVPSDSETGIPAHDPTTMETTVPGVYIAGVIAAGFNANKIFIENGREHGAMIAAHVRKNHR